MFGRGFIFLGRRRFDGIVAAIVRELGLLGNVFKSAIYLFVVGKPCAVIRGSAPTHCDLSLVVRLRFAIYDRTAILPPSRPR
jgi:hypothetical protein